MSRPRLRYRVVGEGPPALLLHGLAATSHVFDPLLRRAASLYRCVVVDLPDAKGPWTLPELSAALLEVVGHENARGAVAVGHSFGGVALLDFAARSPCTLSGLVLASSPALGLGPWASRLARFPWQPRWVRMADRFAGASPLVERYVRSWLAGDPRAISPEQLKGYVRAMRAEGVTTTLAGALCLTQFQLPVERLREAGINPVVLWGDKDRLVPLSLGTQVARALGAPLRVLPGVGHCLPEERPEAILEEMIRLRRVREEKRNP